MPSSSPEAKPAQPKDAQDTSGAKGSCFTLTRPKEAAQLTPIESLAHRSSCVRWWYWYQTLSHFWQSDFPTDTASPPVSPPQNKKSKLSTMMAQPPKSKPPLLLSRNPRRRRRQSRARSPRYPLRIRHPPQQVLIPRKLRPIRTRQSQSQQREYQLSLARGFPMRRSAGARGGY
jgi:hypothetical protein